MYTSSQKLAIWIISAICGAILVMLFAPSIVKYVYTNKKETAEMTAQATSNYAAWIRLGDEWTYIDVEDYSLARSDIITIYCADGVTYRTSYTNVVLIENGG